MKGLTFLDYSETQVGCSFLLVSFLNLILFGRVLAALTRKFRLHENVSLYSVAKKCPPTFTGADMYALCADAWFHAAKRQVHKSFSIFCGHLKFLLVWKTQLYFLIIVSVNSGCGNG